MNIARSCSRTTTHEPHHWDYPGPGIHHDHYDCPGLVTGQDSSDARGGSTGRVGGHVRVSGYVPSAEAWRGGARVLAAAEHVDLDWDHVVRAKAVIAAAVPVEVARLLGEVRALADRWELMAEQHTSPVARVNIGKRADELRAVLDTVGVPAQVDEAATGEEEMVVHAIVRETGDHACGTESGLGTDERNPSMQITCAVCLSSCWLCLHDAAVKGACSACDCMAHYPRHHEAATGGESS